MTGGSSKTQDTANKYGFSKDSKYKSLNSPIDGYEPLAKQIAEEFNQLRLNPQRYALNINENDPAV